jgi:pimeloyl-ACP methyl ester carboxylesterase
VAIARSGDDLAHLLEELALAYPVSIDEILLLGYSMGGLVLRSACHVAAEAGHAWLGKVRRAIYVGTPHLGAPLERAGRFVTALLRAIPDPYTRLVADLADVRSDGVKDLGDADLRHEDRAAPHARLSLRDRHHPVPLLPGIEHSLVAGALGDASRLALFFGDSVVPVGSATNGVTRTVADLALAPDHVRILPEQSHVSLAHDPSVYACIRAWCTDPPPAVPVARASNPLALDLDLSEFEEARWT